MNKEERIRNLENIINNETNTNIGFHISNLIKAHLEQEETYNIEIHEEANEVLHLTIINYYIKIVNKENKTIKQYDVIDRYDYGYISLIKEIKKHIQEAKSLFVINEVKNYTRLDI